MLSGSLLQAPQPVLVQCELVKDALSVLIGVVSATFSLCQVRRRSVAREAVLAACLGMVILFPV